MILFVYIIAPEYRSEDFFSQFDALKGCPVFGKVAVP